MDLALICFGLNPKLIPPTSIQADWPVVLAEFWFGLFQQAKEQAVLRRQLAFRELALT